MHLLHFNRFIRPCRFHSTLQTAAPISPVLLSPYPNGKKRTGLLAVKIGMISVWDFYGVAHGCTVLQVEECQVTQVKTSDIHGFDALQLGVGLRKPRNVVKPLMGHLKKAGVAPKRQLQEFRVSQEGILPAGTTLNATHFLPGQFVDVCGIRYAKNQRRLRY